MTILKTGTLSIAGTVRMLVSLLFDRPRRIPFPGSSALHCSSRCSSSSSSSSRTSWSDEECAERAVPLLAIPSLQSHSFSPFNTRPSISLLTLSLLSISLSLQYLSLQYLSLTCLSFQYLFPPHSISSLHLQSFLLKCPSLQYQQCRDVKARTESDDIASSKNPPAVGM